MPEQSSGVEAAFDILIEEMESEIDIINAVGGRALEAGDYDRAQEMLNRGKRLTGFLDRAEALREDWDAERVEFTAQEEEETPDLARRSLGRLSHGLRTPHEAFFGPILQVIDEAGGSARAGDVIDGIEPLLKGILSEAEYTPLPSDPDQLRWRNRAHWSRHRMVKRALLEPNSPRGIWEISAEGRSYLAEYRSQAR